jgi:hypothetical protein
LFAEKGETRDHNISTRFFRLKNGDRKSIVATFFSPRFSKKSLQAKLTFLRLRPINGTKFMPRKAPFKRANEMTVCLHFYSREKKLKAGFPLCFRASRQ